MIKLTSRDRSLPCKFLMNPQDTKMFNKIDDETAKLFKNVPFAYNLHSFGTFPSKFKSDKGLRNMFRLTSINHDP